MTRWTEDEYRDYMLRQSKLAEQWDPDKIPQEEESESKLAGKIMKWSKEHGYPCQCFRRSIKAKAFLVPGWPD